VWLCQKERERERQNAREREREREREALHYTHTYSKRRMSEAKTKQKACEELVHSGTASAAPTIGRANHSGGPYHSVSRADAAGAATTSSMRQANVAASDRDRSDPGVPPLVGSAEEDDEDEATNMGCQFGGHKCDMCYFYGGAYAPCDICMPCTDERCGPYAVDPFTGYCGNPHHCINACPF
jgi:hypothetical protein